MTALMQREIVSALIDNRPNLLDLVTAGGCAIFVDGKLASIGLVPTEDKLRSVIRWLDEQPHDGVFATDSLPSVFEASKAYCDVGTGLLALSVSRTPKDYVLWFRPELLQVVRWAGNPEKPVEPGHIGASLTPRASFEAWEQTVRFKSEPWTDTQIESAKSLRTSMLEVILHALDIVMKERQAAQSHQDLLMAELDHRVKNTLAVIQSLVRFTARSASSLEEFAASLQSRVSTMARVQTLLTQSHWEGVSIKNLIDDELAPYRLQNEDCCDASGNPLVLKPKAGLGLSMAIHELATNAAKYGSLSSPEGRVRIEWFVAENQEGEWVFLTWTETGGPTVSQPTRVGFGRTLLERTVAHDLQGTVDLEFDPAGVKCRIRIPVSQLASIRDFKDQLPTNDIKATGARAVFGGMRVLVAEDEGLIALDLVEMLKKQGSAAVGPFASVRSALCAAMEGNFDVALLDIDLHGEPVWPIADILIDAGIPFVFTTAYESRIVVPPRFRNQLLISKPYQIEDVIGALSKVMSPG
jgi:light-regulated signal transduction histidine kinase (bacteriophytochrome)/CheY-like chemotaxis protein